MISQEVFEVDETKTIECMTVYEKFYQHPTCVSRQHTKTRLLDTSFKYLLS